MLAAAFARVRVLANRLVVVRALAENKLEKAPTLAPASAP
jgi:hypothetical protein